MKGKRLRSLGGTVLIMVLTVMLVLIIMLMATLTMVTTASQRIYTKYEEQQAYYTARSSLDVFMRMLNDGTYEIDSSGTTQGFEIQKSLYDIIAQSDPTALNPTKNSNPYASGAMATKQYIEYTVGLPSMSDGSGTVRYGKLDDGTSKIKVEVLDRTLDASGNRKKDSMKIKVTATTSFEGVEGIVSVVLGTKPPSANRADRAVTITGGGTMNFNNTSILGGIVAPVNATMGNDPCIWGNVFIGDGFSSAVNLHTTVTDGEWLYVRGKDNGGGRDPISWGNSGVDVAGINSSGDDSKTPNFFMDGDVKLDTSTTYGDVGEEVRAIVTGNLSYNQAATHTFNGDLYVMGDLIVSSSQSLVVTGNLYVGGSCDWSGGGNITVGGSMCAPSPVPRMGGDPAVVQGLTIGGTNQTSLMAVGSTIPITITGLSDGIKSEDQVIAELNANHGDIKIDWNGNVFNMSSEQKLYQQYHWYSDISDGTVTASEYAFLSTEDLEKILDPSETFEYPTDFKRIHEYVDANGGGAAFGTPVKLEGGGRISAPGKYIFDSNWTWFDQNFNGNPFIIDAGGEVEIYIKPGYYSANNGKIIIESGTTVKFYGVGEYWFSHLPIVTREFEDGGTLNVGTYGSDGTAATLMGMPVSYYFEGESIVHIDTDSILVGHCYIPRGSVTNSGSAGTDISSRLIYNNVDFMTNGGRSSRFSILGSVICSGYDSGNSQCGGVAFVKASSEVITPGKPCLEFNASQYSRR
ncbi:MAG: hypothetical protein K2J72_02500 [Oscillospiraceae bacterium]|nr:hypothetical protein [Oscillospiraceae bacterium]